jgi:hypothetical protein
MNKMNISAPQNGIVLGKTDKLIHNIGNFPMYKLNVYDKKGLWLKFKNKLNELNKNNLLKTVTEEEIIKYYYINSDIEFETIFFDDVMKKQYLFNFKDNIFSYSVGKKENTKTLAYVRFYFDLESFLAIDLVI